MTHSVLERILEEGALPSPPRFVRELLDQVEIEDVSIDHISFLLMKAPVTSALILKIANSALFGYSGSIGSIRQATVMLGIRAIKVLALSFSAWDVLQPDSRDFDFTRFLRRSMTTAVMAELLARAMGSVRRDEAFSGGLLCDIGILAAVICVPDEYRKVLAAQAAAPALIQDVERRILNVTHARISAALMRKWGLPGMLSDAVESHHEPAPAVASSRLHLLSRVFWAASTVAEVFCGDVPAAELDSVTERTAAAVGLDIGMQQECMAALDTCLRETARFWQRDIGETVSYNAEGVRGRISNERRLRAR